MTKQASQARESVMAAATGHTFQISLDSETISVVPRVTMREIHRYKAQHDQDSRHA